MRGDGELAAAAEALIAAGVPAVLGWTVAVLVILEVFYADQQRRAEGRRDAERIQENRSRLHAVHGRASTFPLPSAAAYGLRIQIALPGGVRSDMILCHKPAGVRNACALPASFVVVRPTAVPCSDIPV